MKLARDCYTNSPGIAFHLGASVSALLDGHHRGLAAAQEGKSIHCVTISRASWYRCNGNTEQLPTAVTGLFKSEMGADGLSKEAVAWLKSARTGKIPEKAIPDWGVQGEETAPFIEAAWSQAEKALNRYPTVENISAAVAAGTILDDDIEKALRSQSVDPDLGTILNAVIGADDRRTRDLALRILRDENWQSLWTASLQYLGRFEDDEILALFWDMATRDDIKRDDVIKELNRYIEENADKYEK